MPKGDESAYTDKQKRPAEHIEDGYKKKGVSTGEAEKRACPALSPLFATVLSRSPLSRRRLRKYN